MRQRSSAELASAVALFELCDIVMDIGHHRRILNGLLVFVIKGLTINALTAATSVLVPIQCEYYALEGLSQLIHTIDLVKDRLNNDLEIEGVVFTMYDARTNLSLQVVENVKENLQQNIYKTIIPRNVRLAEAPSYGQPITLYDPRSTGAEAYRLLAEEVINREVE